MPPVDMSPARHAIGGFELVCSLKAENQIPVHKYRSRRTGLTVVIAEVEGPVVSGYFCVVTEAHDDDGLPHTLEHLIFLGSESYPYKGVLDLLANRCLASGTNAWTDVDHTCYTMTTAGSEGFLSLMPIYLDHILYPTLTDHGFVTEVHHVTGTGEDAGVVYCEMQGCENTGEERTHFAMMRSIYPGDCGYKANTGGVMKNLRESTTNVKVRQYHKDFYRPDNLTVIITGPVNPADVFKALAGIEDKIVSKGPLGSSKRPWQTPVPPVKESIEQRIEYPCDDEDNGIVNVAWRGPSAVTNVYEMNACALLFRYMTDTSASPLQKEFVEIEDPLASRVGCNVSENSETVIYLTFENVPTDKIELVQPRLIDILKTFADEKEKLDMKRFRTIIHKQMLERLSSLENGPHDIVALMIIGDTLYGNSVEDLNHRLNDIEDLRKMEKEPEHFWLGLLRQYFIDAPMITIKSVPSVDEQKRMTEEEQNRIKKQIEELGEEGLKRKEAELKEAMESNEKPPPDEMLRSVPIPSTDSINFHTIVRYSTETEEQSPKFNLSSLPIYAYLDHINTNFVYMSIFMDTANISSESRFYLPLLLEALLESPVKRGDELISYEEVVSELEADTVATSTRLGVEGGGRFMCGPFSHTASILLQLEVDKYERGIEWLNELLYNTVFTADRLKIIASKISNEVAQVKRNGNKVAKDLMKDIYYDKTSNVHSSSMLRQQQFLLALIEKLNDERANSVMTDIDDVRRILTEPANMVLYMAANVDLVCKKFPDPASLWSKLLPPSNDPIKEKLKVTPDYELFAPESIMETKPSCIVGMGCIESSFFIQTTPSIRDFNDSNLPTVLVFLQYLTQLEGPMWKQIRGAGFSYGFRICPSPNEGLLYLTFYRATNVVQAYTQAKSITETQIESAEWDSTLLESAKSSLIYEIIQREKTIGDVVEQSVLAYFKGVDKDYNRQLVASVNRVTENDLNKVGRKYIIPLFDPESTKTTIVCSPAKAEEIADEFKEMKLHLKVYPSLEDSFLNQM